MISDKYRCIFVHVPKCAGESVEIALSGAPFNTSEYEGHPEKHWGVREIQEAFPEKFARYYKFSVIRNPWERMVSWVSYRDKRWNRKTGSFRERLARDLHDPGFVEYARAHSLTNMLVVDGRLAVDRVIPIERLDDEFGEICQTLGMGKITLPHANRSSYGTCSQYYDAATRERVAELFRDDIAFFRYSFPEKENKA